MTQSPITIYTDGSCNPQHATGAWAALILINEQKIILSGYESPTTHQRMELLAAIKAFQYIKENDPHTHPLLFYTDSEYVVNLRNRKNKLLATNFTTKKQLPIRNADLVRTLLEFMETTNTRFIKVTAHDKESIGHAGNREVDKLVRKMIRTRVQQKNTNG